MKIINYFKLIKDKSTAEWIIDASANCLYFLSGVLVVIAIALYLKGMGLHMLSVAVFYVVTAYLLKKYHSRAIAVTLSILNTISVISGIMSAIRFHIGLVDTLILILAAIVSIRALTATIKYHRFNRTRLIAKNILIQTLVGGLYSTIVLFITIVAMGMAGLLEKANDTLNMTVTVIILILCYGLTFKGLLPFSKNRPISCNEENSKTAD